MNDVRFTVSAIRKVTVPQLLSIARMATDYEGSKVFIASAGFDLPDGYVTFTIEGPNATIYGGIDKDGRVST